MDLDRFTRKVGPLPVWAWALIAVGVGFVGWKLLAGRSSGGAAEADPAADSPDPGAEDGTGLGLASSVGGGSPGVPGSSSGGGGYTAPLVPTDSSGIGLGSAGYSAEDLAILIKAAAEGASGNVHNGSTTSDPGESDTGAAAAADSSATNHANQVSAAQGALNAAKAAEANARSAQAGARAATEAAQNKLNNAKTDAAKKAARSELVAAQARETAAEAAKAAAAAASGTAAANLARLG